MCGITGILSFSSSIHSQNLIQKMNDSIAHRGPDGEGFFCEDALVLGHRRLSIIDLSLGNQPMHSANGQAVVVFNGEIYNFLTLRKELLARGYPFQTHSDTEVILALYQLEGEEGFKKLAGMFAFALWDRALKHLLLVRDRAGMKPLYYAKTARYFVFSSEIKAILTAFPEFTELDSTAVNFYFSRQYIGGHGTIFKGIKKVMPANCLKITQDGALIESSYWTLTPQSAPKISFEESIFKTGELLKESVQSHLHADVPVGLFLSGGLDSSTLLSYAASATTKPLHTFSVGFGEQSKLNETHFAKKLAHHYGTEHHEIHVTENEVLDCLPHIIRQMDEPLADYALLPTYVMSKFAASHVKVALSGEGADELFGGYKRYLIYALLDQQPFHTLFKNKLPGFSVFPESLRRKLLQPGVFIKNQDSPQEQKIKKDKAYFFAAGHLNSMLYADMQNWLVDDLLMKVDKMGMLASLESRMPYLDHRLVEYVAVLPPAHKVGWRQKKLILRSLAQERLPPEISARAKHGFTAPVGEWLKGPLKNLFEERVLGDTSNQAWLDLKFVQKLFSEHLGGKEHRLQLWAILVFCLWLRR